MQAHLSGQFLPRHPFTTPRTFFATIPNIHDGTTNSSYSSIPEQLTSFIIITSTSIILVSDTTNSSARFHCLD
ncbi:predicted protein [Lichtheimia corymbifera JMRC:FSU:9682]|uniref:Uncharacterized protein n=1 Tax=Lichtheimia corymbifera JMRC:FSU:9682 TaxID=1263082 RepID=A0A068SF89_9FUNG|nr:predicted protein [Lichtheimia corymbifera JMRC:FSU:9682]